MAVSLRFQRVLSELFIFTKIPLLEHCVYHRH